MPNPRSRFAFEIEKTEVVDHLCWPRPPPVRDSQPLARVGGTPRHQDTFCEAELRVPIAYFSGATMPSSAWFSTLLMGILPWWVDRPASALSCLPLAALIQGPTPVGSVHAESAIARDLAEQPSHPLAVEVGVDRTRVSPTGGTGASAGTAGRLSPSDQYFRHCFVR